MSCIRGTRVKWIPKLADMILTYLKTKKCISFEPRSFQYWLWKNFSKGLQKISPNIFLNNEIYSVYYTHQAPFFLFFFELPLKAQTQLWQCPTSIKTLEIVKNLQKLSTLETQFQTFKLGNFCQFTGLHSIQFFY